MTLWQIWRRLTHRAAPWPLTDRFASVPSFGPPLAVVVVCYRMTHQIANTIRSLVPPYQQGVAVDQFEIHLIDNGSPTPLDDSLWNLAPNVHYHHVPPESASANPGAAINHAVARFVRSPLLCVMIDGARMLTPGVLKWGIDLAAASAAGRAIVDVRSFHLGHKSQNDSLAEGYSPAVEKELLASIGWPGSQPQDGYRLFDIAFPSLPTRGVFFGSVFESNCLFISRTLFDQLGGYDERYADPGGGLVGVDFFRRAVAAADLVFTLLGEGTFHQTHGGAASGLHRKQLDARLVQWRAEYERLSRPWRNVHRYKSILAGHLPPPCRRWLIKQPKKR
jgi:hypothetical protein